MAQGSRGKSDSGKSGPSFSKAAAAKPAAGSSPASPPGGRVTSSRPPVRNQGPSTKGRPPAKKGRESVAAARRANSGSNRTQLRLLVIAVVVMAILVVIGLVLYQRGTKVQAADYGASVGSASTVSNGVVTVDNGAAAPVTIDIYQDAMCPICQQFEHQFGQQIAQAVDQGKLGVRYHALTFLNGSSFSKDYSTRAAAAMLCVAEDKSAPKGLFFKYLTHLYADDTKPTEGGSSDLSNQQLADLAKADGASTAAASCVSTGANVPAAEAGDKSGEADLAPLPGGVGTPRVTKDGQLVDTNSTNWLTDLLPKS